MPNIGNIRLTENVWNKLGITIFKVFDVFSFIFETF